MKIKEWLKKNKEYVIIILVALLICAPLTVEGWISTDDGYSHLARNYNTIQGLKDGQFPPVIVSNFCKGFGYSWNLFYPPLSTYIGAIFRLIVPTYVAAMKLTIVFAVIMAGITMFQLMRKVTKNSNTSLITSIIYITANYLITDIYARMAMGEIMVFIFFPILFNGLYSIFYEKGEKNYLLTIGAVGILLSHNISALMAVILSIIFVIINFKKLYRQNTRKQVWKNIIVNAIFIILIVLFFYVPFLQHQMATEYVVMEDNSMTSKEFVSNHAIYIYQLFFGKFQKGASYALDQGVSNEMFFSLGLPIIVSLLFTPMAINKIEKGKKHLYILTLIAGIITALMATTLFPWSKMPHIILMIQFPWRMLLISTFLLSIIAGINISKIFRKFKIENIFMIILIIILYSGQYISYVVNFDIGFDESYLGKVAEIDDLSGANKYCSSFEYLPSKARTEYTQNREDGVIVLSGDAVIKDEKKENNDMQFLIEENTQESNLELPYIYYLGYKITLNGNSISYQESEHGFISISIPKDEKGKVVLTYEGTKLSKISLFISIVSALIFIGYIILENKRKKIDIDKK